MRLALVVLAACYTGAPAIAPAPAPPTPIDIAVHAPRGGSVELVAAAGLSDGGLIVVTHAFPACERHERGLAVTRFDTGGHARWTRCVPETPWGRAVAAASDDGVWIAQTVEPSAAEHVHGDDRDLVVARHVRADGVVGEARTIVRYHAASPSRDPGSVSNLARNSVENLRLSAAAVAHGELIVAGATKAGAIVDGAWQTEADGISMQGVVLAVPLDGPVRVIAASANALFEDVAVAGQRYVATGWCSHASNTPGDELFACPPALTAFAITGELGAAPRVHVLGADVYDAHAAIDRDGAITVAASAWRSPVTIDGATIASTCARFAFAVSWTRAGELGFARPLADCTQPHASPFALDGHAVSAADDNISEHLLDVAGVAMIDRAPIVTIRAEETNHLDWPVHVDSLALPAPFGRAGAVLVLDQTGRIVRHRVLLVDGRPARHGQPDTSLAKGAGVDHVIATQAGTHSWLVVEHGGSIAIDRRRFALGSKLDETDDLLGRHELHCDAAAITERPDVGEMVHEIRDGGGEPEDFACRRRVEVEVGIEIVAF